MVTSTNHIHTYIHTDCLRFDREQWLMMNFHHILRDGYPEERSRAVDCLWEFCMELLSPSTKVATVDVSILPKHTCMTPISTLPQLYIAKEAIKCPRTVRPHVLHVCV